MGRSRGSLAKTLRRSLAALLVLAVAYPAITYLSGSPAMLAPLISLRFAGVRSVSPAALREALDSGGPVQLLDVRRPDEYRVSHIAGATRVDPDAAELPAIDPGADVIVYCSVGYRSSQLAKRLAEAGHDNVQNLSGGIFAWANAGYAVSSVNGQVHPYDGVWGRFLNKAHHHHASTAGTVP